jgi:hypothetical protein
LFTAAVAAQQPPPVRFVDVTKAAGIAFTHTNGAFGKKYLPETLGAGAAFLDYNNDGRQDVLLVNGSSWAGQPPARAFSRLYRNDGSGRFTDVTKAAGLQVELYGMGVAAADFDNDGWQDVLITAVGQNRLFRNNGAGVFTDVTMKSGLGPREGFSTSALWFDYDRDGWLDLLICNYVRWTPETDVYCSVDGKQKSYCTPEAYRGATSWLFRNRRNGTFEDATATAGIFDTTSKSLGVTLLDYDNDVWPDVFVANDTQPNKLYRNTGRERSRSSDCRRASPSAKRDARAPAWASMPPTWTTPAARPWRSPTSRARWWDSTSRSARGSTPTRRRGQRWGASRATRSASAASSSTSTSTGSRICSS